MSKYILSREAQSSLKEIQIYSAKTFGKERTKQYLASIRKRMKVLSENPSLGIVREDLKVGYHSDFIGSHTIYYRIQSTHIDVIDVLHQSMDPSKHITD
ncbi:MAG: type II toxin-antitoxin system RelE/ParE family toxin [Gammaproteobacteria bacterium]|nr:type II toxin-antitoxin system RelE/ParE family toxin [Gammaproteobacteria bacterium]